jgi:hypothetical protein
MTPVALTSGVCCVVPSTNDTCIPEEKSRGPLPGKRLAQLLRGPGRGRMVRDPHVHGTTALVSDDDQDEEQAACRCRHHEEVRRHDLSDVIAQERPPGLRRRSPMADHVRDDGALTDVQAQFQQLTVDPRRTPERVGPRHGANQLLHLIQHGWATRAWNSHPRPFSASIARRVACDRTGRSPSVWCRLPCEVTVSARQAFLGVHAVLPRSGSSHYLRCSPTHSRCCAPQLQVAAVARPRKPISSIQISVAAGLR